MGWSSGTTLMEQVIGTVQSYVPDADIRYKMYVELVEAFQDADWDNLDEVTGKDPAYDKMYAEMGNEDEEEFQECRLCFDEHPVNVLEDGLCPGCVDEDVD